MARDIEIKISAKDFATGVLQKLGQESQRTAQRLTSFGDTAKSLAFNGAGIAAGIAGFQGLTAAINATAGSVLSFTRSMETNEIGIAGILSSMTQLNGKNLEWNQALGFSKTIMSQLNDEALRTNATTEELTTTFRALLGPGLGAGMKIDEIIKLSSVGATAVKSLGLNGVQLVQELRDLVQGGIAPASSTLATALGLKDSDIKAAKASSEGLFKFLMERLEGFEMSGEASKRTFDGIIDQIKEGVQRIGQESTGSLFGAAKEELAELANGLIYVNEETKKVELNKDLVNDLTYASDRAVEFGRNIAEAAQPIVSVAVPAAKLLGETMIYVGEHARAIGVSLSTWYVLDKVSGYYKDIAAAATGSTTAQTMLGRTVASVRMEYEQQALKARQAAAAETQAAMQASASVLAAIEERKVARANEQVVTQAVIKAEQAGWEMMAMQIRQLQMEYVKLGASAEQAGAMQLQAAKLAQAGQFALASQVMSTQRAHLQSAAAARSAELAAVTGATNAAGKVKTLTSAVWALAGGWTGVALAIGYATYALINYINQKDRIKSYDPDAAVYYRNGKYYKRHSWVDPDNPEEVMTGEIELNADEYKLQYEKDAQEKANDPEEIRKRAEEKAKKEQEELEKRMADLANKAFGGGGGDDKAAAKAAQAAERAAREKARLQDKVADILSGYDKKIHAETDTDYTSGMLNLNEEIANTRRELDKNRAAFARYGIDVKAVEDKVTEYQVVMSNKLAEEQLRNLGLLKNETALIMAGLTDDYTGKAEAEYQTKLLNIEKQRKEKYKATGDKGAADAWAKASQEQAEHEKNEAVRNGILERYGLDIQYNNLRLVLENKTQAEIDLLNRQKLQNKLSYLDQELQAEGKTQQEYIELAQEKYDTITALNDACNTDMSEALRLYLDELHRQSKDWKQVYSGVFSSIETDTKNHLDSMISGAESFSNGFTGIFKSMADQIRKTWIEMWYDTVIKRPMQDMIGRWLGVAVGAGTGAGGGSSGEIKMQAAYEPDAARAGGGPVEAGKLYRVGEHGEEWFMPREAGTIIPNFKLDGIYRQDFSVQNRSTPATPNITVNVINKTDTQVKATATTQSVSPDNMVINIVLEAIERNKGGLRDLISAIGKY